MLLKSCQCGHLFVPSEPLLRGPGASGTFAAALFTSSMSFFLFAFQAERRERRRERVSRPRGLGGDLGRSCRVCVFGGMTPTCKAGAQTSSSHRFSHLK